MHLPLIPVKAGTQGLGLLLAGAVLTAFGFSASANVIDGSDGRGSLVDIGPALGLSAGEIARIRAVTGNVGCAGKIVTAGSGALFLADDIILTAAHVLFAGGKRQMQCYFRPQAPGAGWIALKTAPDEVRMGAPNPKPGSNDDWAVVRLASPVPAAQPFAPGPAQPAAGDRLVVVGNYPVETDGVPNDMPVVQACAVRRAPVSKAATSFYRTDCDASPAASGGMHLLRAGDGLLHFVGITLSSGPSEDGALRGAPYNEAKGSVTTALGTDAAILAAGRALAGLSP